MGVIVSQQINL